MKKRNLVLLCGGRSGEHRVSLASASFLLERLRALDHPCYPVIIAQDGRLYRYNGNANGLTDAWQQAATPITLCWDGATATLCEAGQPPLIPDRILSCLHGGDGENGAIQGLLSALGLPFVGCGVLPSALTADKAIAKTLVAEAGIPTAPFRIVRSPTEIPEDLPFPIFVKPIDGGSSIGATLVRERAALPSAVIEALSHSEAALLEDYICGTEIELGVIEQADGSLTVSTPGEIAVRHGFYDYETKYQNSNVETHIPARLTEEETQRAKQTAATVFRLLRCRHFCRIDFFRTADGTLYFNEVNTLPGFTRYSMFPLLFAHDGIDAVETLLSL